MTKKILAWLLLLPSPSFHHRATEDTESTERKEKKEGNEADSVSGICLFPNSYHLMGLNHFQ
jgi:hypothetical protein